MIYTQIINLISKQLADELVSEPEMLSYMDRVVDDINVQMNTKFPTFTDFRNENSNIPSHELDYTAIPDKYIRTVVVPGAAFKFYTTDEEGGYSSPKYEEDYKQGLFYMMRDFLFSVPEEYREEDNQGYVDMEDFNSNLEIHNTFRGGLF